MTSSAPPRTPLRASFRLKLLVAMMVVVSGTLILAVYVARRKLADETAHDLEQAFQAELATFHHVQEVRHAALAERCRALVRRPRLHAALEDNALDLLYLSAQDELRDVVEWGESNPDSPSSALRAEFYRFLDVNGAVIPPDQEQPVGALTAAEESQLTLKAVTREQQFGYLARATGSATNSLTEIIAMPIISTETGDPIAALVLGFRPVALGARRADLGTLSGVWFNKQLYLPLLSDSSRTALADQLSHAISSGNREESSFHVAIYGVPHLLFYKRSNPASLYPPAYEVCIFPLTELLTRQRQLGWQIVGAGVLLLIVGFGASHYLAARLSLPVEKLAVDSEVNRTERERAEHALEQTSVELQRSIRFSADASHQLKTPTTVLRAGLEELLARENLRPEAREEISELIHQTYRLTGVIEDLLLLSRMDAGRLQLTFAPVNLSQLLEAELDDLSAQPEAVGLEIQPEFPPALHVLGEKRYTTHVVRNLLENARKYNRPGGCIRVQVVRDTEDVRLTIGNTGRPIPAAAQERIFERFHRGSAGENIPGHGLGLNIARELARLHGGDLRLVRSDEAWTEFEVRFRLSKPEAIPAPA